MIFTIPIYIFQNSRQYLEILLLHRTLHEMYLHPIMKQNNCTLMSKRANCPFTIKQFSFFGEEREQRPPTLNYIMIHESALSCCKIMWCIIIMGKFQTKEPVPRDYFWSHLSRITAWWVMNDEIEPKCKMRKNFYEFSEI